MRLFILALLSLVLPVTLHASIVYSGVQDIAIPTTFDGIYLDFTDGDDASVFTTSTSNQPASWDLNLFFGGAVLANSSDTQMVTGSTTTNSTVLNLAPLSTVDASSGYPSSYSGSTGHMGGGSDQFTSGTRGYLGFRVDATTFDTNAGTGYYYGWMQVTLNNDNTVGTIHDWAWDNTGAGILVPEVGTLGVSGVLLLGGLVLGRRRNQRPVPGSEEQAPAIPALRAEYLH